MNPSQATTTQQYLIEDGAHLLNSRGVIQLSGAQAAQALQPVISKSLATETTRKATLAYMLTDTGKVFADLFIVPYKTEGTEEVLLLDCPRTLLAAIIERLLPQCDVFNVTATDVSESWRVFGELPNQTTYDVGTPLIKYTDPRWHMGARILRPKIEAESSNWGHENRWRAHAYRLGFLPSAELLRGISVSPMEANLHLFGQFESGRGYESSSELEDETPARRVLPMRIEPSAFLFPTMTGLALMAGDAAIGTVLGHQSIYGLVLTDISAWRKALQAGHVLTCGGQTVLLTWPQWLAAQSRGRAGPVSRSIPGAKATQEAKA